jgi:para-nitrobenzyl esterase
VSDTERSTATISTGILSGTSRDGIRTFLGIPYAQPPFGSGRFAAPVPAAPWNGERAATSFGPTPPQDPYFGAIGELLGSVEIEGEDILTANVWAPAGAHGLPVMVWDLGGALARGAAALPDYDGSAFARDGVVFVSVNYRVGAEGFGVLDDAPRNLGLADAALALQWVHREIGAFGGDPTRITIVGESAGGAIVAALLSRADTVGLLAGAIIESGPLDAVPEATARRVTDAIAAHLGIPATRSAFAAVSPRALLDARRTLAAGGNILLGSPSYALVLDEESLPVSPRAAIPHVAIPVLIGSNTDEYRLWFPPAAIAAIGEPQLAMVQAALGLPTSVVDTYRATWPDAGAGELLGQLITDSLMRGPAVQVADARTAPTYVYEFAWRSPVRELRATHALEIGFVFDRLRGDGAFRLTGPDAPQVLADRMHADWVSFVSHGDPGWPTFAPGRIVRRYDEVSETVPLPRAAAVDALLAAH